MSFQRQTVAGAIAEERQASTDTEVLPAEAGGTDFVLNGRFDR